MELRDKVRKDRRTTSSLTVQFLLLFLTTDKHYDILPKVWRHDETEQPPTALLLYS